MMLNHDPTGTRFSRSKVSPLASDPGVGWPTAFDPGRIAARHSAPTADTSLIRGTALALALLIEPASADTVIMRNGDRLTGEVLRQEGSELLIRTAYAGTIALAWGQVSDVRLDAPATVLLDDERVVTVAALTREKESLRFETLAGREPMTVSTNQVRVIQPEPWEMGDGGKFSGRINLALEDQTGNSESTELDVDATLRYRRRWSEFESFGQFEYDTANDQSITDKWTLNNKYTRFFPKTRWYGAAWLRLKNDRFADVRLRTIAGPAAGYAFEPGGARLNLEVGPVYLNEDYYTNDNESYWGPGLFVDYEQPVLGERLEVYLHGMGFTALSDDSKDLWVSWAGLRMPLSRGFVGAIEYEIDHDDPPAVNAKPTDETLRLKLGYEW